MNNQLLASLRSETARLHELLDQNFSGGQFSSRETYVAFLKMQAQVLPGVEAVLKTDPTYQTLDNWQARLRTPALRRDLAALGMAPARSQLFKLDNEPGCIAGITYVLEGSRLGGRMIANNIARAGLHDLPQAFITHGSDMRYWKSFIAWLETRNIDERYRENAITAAKSMFQAFINSAQANLNQPHQPREEAGLG